MRLLTQYGRQLSILSAVLIAVLFASSATVATASYLDRCDVAGDCASGICLDDLGGTRFCSISCSLDNDCADDHFCVGSVCVPNDTGVACTSSASCAKSLCLGSSYCTQECTSASECPAGYACGTFGPTKACVNIEVPCAECLTGICTGGGFCTTTCTSAFDCPTTFPGLQYTCSGGVCEPSVAISGEDQIGAVCVVSPATSCRSGLCNDLTTPFTCTQACTAAGNCGPGSGCVPEPDGGGGTLLLCEPAGAGDLGTACINANDCRSGLCSDALKCTRLCADSLCPTGFECSSSSGAPICAAVVASVPALAEWGRGALLALIFCLSAIWRPRQKLST